MAAYRFLGTYAGFGLAKRGGFELTRWGQLVELDDAIAKPAILGKLGASYIPLLPAKEFDSLFTRDEILAYSNPARREKASPQFGAKLATAWERMRLHRESLMASDAAKPEVQLK